MSDRLRVAAVTPPAPSPLALADEESGPWCVAARLAYETWDLSGPQGRVFASCGLTAKQSVVFVLHHGRGLSLRAIAGLTHTRSNAIFRHLATAELKFHRRQAQLRLWATFNRLVSPPGNDEELRRLDALMREPPGGVLWQSDERGRKRPREAQSAVTATLASLAGRGFIEDLAKKVQGNVGIDTAVWRVRGRPTGWRDRASSYDRELPGVFDEEEKDARQASPSGRG